MNLQDGEFADEQAFVEAVPASLEHAGSDDLETEIFAATWIVFVVYYSAMRENLLLHLNRRKNEIHAVSLDGALVFYANSCSAL